MVIANAIGEWYLYAFEIDGILFFMFSVYHADSALKVAPACLKFKLLKAESLALLGRTEVRHQHRQFKAPVRF